MTVKETKKQHFLPFTYLKYFHTSDSPATRDDALIYRDNGKDAAKDRAAKQCYKHNFYRKENTKESEEAFQVFENDWDECVSDARQSKPNDPLLFMQIINYHFRNFSMRLNTSFEDRFQLVIRATANFIEQKILHLKDGQSFKDDPRFIRNFPWSVKLIRFEKPILITSDNPSVLTAETLKVEQFAPFFLPISPTELLIAFDKSRYRLKRLQGTDKDGYIANSYVACQAVHHIYYSSPLTPSERDSLWDLVDRKGVDHHQRGQFTTTNFVPTLALYQMQFSFIEKRPNPKLTRDIKKAIHSFSI